MTDEKFEQLKRDIEVKTIELNRLQDLYRKQTGRSYVVPLRLTDITVDIDGVCYICGAKTKIFRDSSPHDYCEDHFNQRQAAHPHDYDEEVKYQKSMGHEWNLG